MIEEQYVSFDTAKLLKDAGFNIPCRGIYVTDHTGYYEFREYDNKQTTNDLCWNTEDGFQYEYLAPTQALAARWLRETHAIDIVIGVVDARFYYVKLYQRSYSVDMNTIFKPTYEEALEEGLREAIKLIKK